MDDGEVIFSYSFNREEAKLLSVLLRKQGVPKGLFTFSKTLNAALSRRLSLEEAEALFHE